MSSSSSFSTSFRSGRVARLSMVAMLMLALAGCDYVEKFKKFRQTPEEAKAEGVALGAGCRQVGQSLEDCYQLNPNALKAGIFTGWKDMHEYMAAKGIDTVKPPAPEPTEEEKAAAAKAAEEKAQADKEAADKAAAPVDERAARREKRERERAMKEKGGKDKDSSKS
ncbi:hypothetical protein FHW67_000403 [Herbaspirillum sp. Sphag1AN]|nr:MULTISPECIES: hypothetical protein [unclassified Herbaspirillum]MBB3211168.1 hypothetical protein [Herbaspirillum sp. Sphag1AN]MBB3244797.1 hypothetical protein [Herbaspirillum sp. Sphag64]